MSDIITGPGKYRLEGCDEPAVVRQQSRFGRWMVDLPKSAGGIGRYYMADGVHVFGKCPRIIGPWEPKRVVECWVWELDQPGHPVFGCSISAKAEYALPPLSKHHIRITDGRAEIVESIDCAAERENAKREAEAKKRREEEIRVVERAWFGYDGSSRASFAAAIDALDAHRKARDGK